ncbi:hypothetical protein TOPH_05367, partial [Tolypocladium ophioglossoides CBS 100239]
MDEYEQRLDLAERIQTLLRDTANNPTGKFSAVQFAAILVAPVARLREFAQYEFDRNYSKILVLRLMLHQVSPLVHHFLRKPAKAIDSAGPQGIIRRNQVEVKQCRLRDGGLCIVTGTGCPSVCHIVPFTWNHTVNSAHATREVLAMSPLPIFYEQSDWTGLIHTKLYAGPGSSDKSWNMLSLSYLLHKWWSKGYFGLKYLGTTPSSSSPQDMHTIELQFRWLPRSQEHPMRPIELQEQRDTTKGIMIYQLDTDSPKAGANFGNSNRPICSDHTFQVHINQKDSPFFVATIKLRWAILQVAAMSGGAQAPELLQGHDPDPDP